MCELKEKEIVEWTQAGQEMTGTISRILKDGIGVLIDHGGPLPLQAREFPEGWFVYTGSDTFTIPLRTKSP